MASKLIATEFVYSWSPTDGFGKPSTQRGSYLGRKVATARTLRAFVNRNIRACNAALRLDSLTVAGSYVSQWVAK